jgi:hypothetical protein
MITTTHAILNSALLGRQGRPGRGWPVVLGSMIPDLPMFLYFFTVPILQLFIHHDLLHRVYYWPYWRNCVDWSHSIPLALVGILLFWLLKREGAIYFFLAMLFHDLEDLPVHATFPHAHWVPFSRFRYFSPISYYDPRFFGAFFAPFEWLLVVLCVWVLWKRGLKPWVQVSLLVVCVFQGMWLVYFYAGWRW